MCNKLAVLFPLKWLLQRGGLVCNLLQSTAIFKVRRDSDKMAIRQSVCCNCGVNPQWWNVQIHGQTVVDITATILWDFHIFIVGVNVYAATCKVFLCVCQRLVNLEWLHISQTLIGFSSGTSQERHETIAQHVQVWRGNKSTSMWTSWERSYVMPASSIFTSFTQESEKQATPG